MESILNGATIDGKFKLMEQLGAGGMGVVYKAKQEDLNRFVALKILNFSAQDDPESKARFLREARVLANLNHERIVTIYNFGHTIDSTPFIAMEYLDGIPLSRLNDSEEKTDLDKLLTIFLQATDALAYAHKEGIIHRDLKPENIFLLSSADSVRVKILDFGFSKLIKETGQKLTSTGMLLGSIHYMSPESCTGSQVDQRSDIYSLGCVFYECLAGRKPFDADNPVGLLHMHNNEEPEAITPDPKNPQRSAAAISIIRKAMKKRPEERFQTVSEMNEAIRLLLNNKLDKFHELDIADPQQSPKDKSKTLWISLVLLLALVSISVLAIPKRQNPKTPPVMASQSKPSFKLVGANHRTKLRAASSAFHKLHMEWGVNRNPKAKEELLRLIEEIGLLLPQMKTLPERVATYQLRARCLSEIGQNEEAAADFEKALILTERKGRPPYREYIEVARELASLQVSMGKYDEARKNSLTVIELMKQFDKENQSGIEGAYLGSTSIIGDYVGLERGFSYNTLASVAQAKKNYPEMEKYSRLAADRFQEIKIFDGETSLRASLGDALWIQNKKKEALYEMARFKLRYLDFFRSTVGFQTAYHSQLANYNSALHCGKTLEDWFHSHGQARDAAEIRKTVEEINQRIKELKALEQKRDISASVR